MNKVELQGKIIRIFKGKSVSILTLFVNGYSKNYPQIVFNYQDKDKVDNFKLGDFVNIIGTIKVRGLRGDNGYQYYNQYIKGIEISPAKTDLTTIFGTDLGGRYTYVNDIQLKGTIGFNRNNNNVANIYVKPENDKFRIKLTSFERNPDEFLEKYPEGSEVYISAEVQTVRKEKDDRVNFFENFVVKEIDNAANNKTE